MRLSRPQADLLAEIVESGGLYIRRYGQYGRTAESLVKRGLLRIDERDWSSFNMDHYVATPDGSAVGTAPDSPPDDD